jgi:hypothetical protein
VGILSVAPSRKRRGHVRSEGIAVLVELVISSTSAGLEVASRLTADGLNERMRRMMLPGADIVHKATVSLGQVDRLASLEAWKVETSSDEQEQEQTGNLHLHEGAWTGPAEGTPVDRTCKNGVGAEEEDFALSVNAQMDIVVQGLVWVLRCPKLKALRPLTLMALRRASLGSRPQGDGTSEALQAEGMGKGSGASVKISRRGDVAGAEPASVRRFDGAERMRGFVARGGLSLLLSCLEEADVGGDEYEKEGNVVEEVCGLVSALLVAGTVAPADVLAIGGAGPGGLVARVIAWMRGCTGPSRGLVQGVCLLANLVVLSDLERQPPVPEVLLQQGALAALVHVQRQREADAELTAHLLRFLNSVAATPASCNAVFSNSAAHPPTMYTASLMSVVEAPQQRPNYFLADDIRRTGIHDSILTAVRKYRHPLMEQVRHLHAAVATPSWGQQNVLTRDAKRKIRRVLGYASTSTATYSAATALLQSQQNRSPRICGLRPAPQLPPPTSLEDR